VKASVGNNWIDQKASDIVSDILALGILAIGLAIGMWFTGSLMSLINPWLAVEYYVAAILIVIMTFYLISYFARYN